MPKTDKDYWKSQEYIQRCREHLEEIEPVVSTFYWYSSGEGLDRLKETIKTDADFVYYVHRCHSMLMRYCKEPYMDCPYCDDECPGWDLVSKRCDNDGHKDFFWVHDDESFEHWVESYSIDDKFPLGYPSTC